MEPLVPLPEHAEPSEKAAAFAKRRPSQIPPFDPGPEWQELAEEIASDLENIALRAATHTAAHDLAITNVDLLTGINRAASAWAKDRAAELVGMRRDESGDLIENPDATYRIDQTTRESLREIVAQAFDEQTSMRELADRIRTSDALSPARAALIAQTEAARAETQGNLTAWRGSGAVATVAFVMSEDHGGEDECDEAAANGPYALDEAPEPPLHPNCFCSLTIAALTDEE